MQFLYRKSSGQVLGVSSDDSYGGLDTPFLTAATDPATPDGIDLSVPKIFVSGTNTVRNATSGEIAGFPAAEAADMATEKKSTANTFLDQLEEPIGILVQALALVVLDEVNALRSAAGLPARTVNQLRGSIKAKVQNLL